MLDNIHWPWGVPTNPAKPDYSNTFVHKPDNPNKSSTFIGDSNNPNDPNSPTIFIDKPNAPNNPTFTSNPSMMNYPNNANNPP